ncbi:TPA: hypothetical protein I8654_000583 [Morganella morganii]|nr:hypothetical protein [Morganella morganii]
MNNGLSGKIYSDTKLLAKKAIKIIAILVAILIAAFAINFAYNEYKLNKKESAILEKAIPFTQKSKPLEFIRSDFGSSSSLYLWFIPDTDRHVVIRVGEKYSVFSSGRVSNGSLTLHRRAGDACDYYSSLALDEKGNVISVSCDNTEYYDGPWRFH